LIKEFYLLVSKIVLFLLFVVVAILFALSNELSSQFIIDKILSNNKIEYSKIEGSVVDGLILHDIKYENAISSKTLEIRYDPKNLFTAVPVLKYIKIDGLSIDFAYFEDSKDKGDDEALAISFALEQLQLTNMKILLDKQEIDLDVDAKNILYDGKLSVKKLLLEVASADANITMDAKIESNHLFAQTLVTPSKDFFTTYLSSVRGVSKTLPITINADLNKVSFHTKLENISLISNDDLAISNANITLHYFINENYFTLETEYQLSYSTFEGEVKQTAIFTSLGEYYTQADIKILKSPFKLPFSTFKAEVAGNTQDMIASVDTPKIHFESLGTNYESFIIRGLNKELSLAFTENEFLKEDSLKVKTEVLLNLSPLNVQGTLHVEDMYAVMDGSFESYDENILALATLHPKQESDFYAKYKLDLFSPLEFTLFGNEKKAFVNIDANLLHLTLYKEDKALTGWGNLTDNSFEVSGDISDIASKFLLKTNIPSVHSLLEDFSLNDDTQNSFYDAEVNINATLTLADKIEVNSKINVPWYVIQTDSQTVYQAENLFAHVKVRDNEIDIMKYNISFLNHTIKSDRASKLIYKQNATIEFKELWIYDNLKLSGLLNMQELQGDLNLNSSAFHYDGSEANITAKVDINAHFDVNKTQKIEGSVTLLDGTVKYEPTTDYKISDEDIIIIQDIKEPSKVRRDINIHINSIKPILYKTKDIDMKFTPDFSIIQEVNEVPRFYGMVGIKNGVIEGAGKKFTLEKSEVYFYGAYPVNPYLNLHLKYYIDTDNIDIDIFVTNTAESPVIIFSSTPAMSQDDILSYILFGEPASSVFESSTSGSTKASLGTLFMGTGLKTIFNDVSGINIDKLNIITNAEGTFGYEIGARFNKQIRVIYTNDNTQSVTLQYSLSNSVRIDVDVHETGQGVTILYVKDYKDLDVLKKSKN